MSIEAIAWVLKHSKAKGAARLVAISIANHVTRGSEVSWPSSFTIAREAKVHRSTVFPAIEELQRLGELAILPSNGRSNHYRLLLMSPQLDLGCRPSRQISPQTHLAGDLGGPSRCRQSRHLLSDLPKKRVGKSDTNLTNQKKEEKPPRKPRGDSTLLEFDRRKDLEQRRKIEARERRERRQQFHDVNWRAAHREALIGTGPLAADVGARVKPETLERIRLRREREIGVVPIADTG